VDGVGSGNQYCSASPVSVDPEPVRQPGTALRKVGVALKLAMLGAAGGALAGVLGTTTWVLFFAAPSISILPFVWAFSIVWGGLWGALLMPLSAFLILRTVSLGRMLLTTVLVTAATTVLSLLFLSDSPYLLIAPAFGALAAAYALAWGARRRDRQGHSAIS
jgi:hypothetical protein